MTPLMIFGAYAGLANRTSFFHVLMAALCSGRGSLIDDVEHSEIALMLDGNTNTRTFERPDGTVVVQQS